MFSTKFSTKASKTKVPDEKDDPMYQQGPRTRSPAELQALWDQTKLPPKYRDTISDEELDQMANQAQEQGVKLRSVIADRVRQDRNLEDNEDFDDSKFRHKFSHHTHREGFKFANPWNYLKELFVMAIIPTIVFMGIGVMFIMMYYLLPWITLFVIFTITALSCLVLLSGVQSEALSRTFLGTLLVIACFTGTLAGMAVYYDIVFFYWSATEGQQYTNVRSDSLAAAHADAGVMVFTDEAVVDTTKTTGFKAGETYCVAPIARKEQTHAAQVQYWAAGMDCCNRRGFFSCDDATDKAAKSGLVIREPASGLIPSLLFKSEVEYYKHAVEMATEIYGVTVAKEPHFVRWITDVEAKANSYFYNGWLWWGYYGLAFFLLNLVLSCLLQGVLMGAKNKEKDAEGEKAALLEHGEMTVTKGPGHYRIQGARANKGLEAEMDDELMAGSNEPFEAPDHMYPHTEARLTQTQTGNYDPNQPTPTFANGLPYDDPAATLYEPNPFNHYEPEEDIDQTTIVSRTDPRQGLSSTPSRYRAY